MSRKIYIVRRHVYAHLAALEPRVACVYTCSHTLLLIFLLFTALPCRFRYMRLCRAPLTIKTMYVRKMYAYTTKLEFVPREH